MSQFLQLLLASAGGTTVILLIMAFLARTWIASRIQESVKFDYAKDIEKYKADLHHENAKELEKFKSSLQERNAQTLHEIQQESKLQAVDNATFLKLLNLLASVGIISFLKDHNFGDSFERSKIDPLYDFIRAWNNAEHSFLNSDLDAGLKQLRNAVDNFLDDLATNTFVVGPDSSFLSVPKDWEEKQPDLFYDTVKLINQRADAVVERQQSLVRSARQILKC